MSSINYVDNATSDKIPEYAGTDTATSPMGAGQSGGFFWGSSENDSKLIKACKEGEYRVVKFMLFNDMISDYTTHDEKGNTLLHYIAKKYEQIPEAEKILDRLMCRSDKNSFINCQNDDGDTPLIIATKEANFVVCNRLVQEGADQTIKNKDGVYVGSDSEFDKSVKSEKEKLAESPKDEEIGRSISGFINTFMKLNELRKRPASPTATPGMMPTVFPELTQTTVQAPTPQVPASVQPNNLQQSAQVFTKPTTPSTQATLAPQAPAESTNTSIKFSENSPKSVAKVGTEEFVKMLESTFGANAQSTETKSQSGGNSRSGHRTISTYSEMGGGVKKSKKSTKHTNDESDDTKSLNHLIERQKDTLHEDTVKKIIEIMNVDELTARNYKAALWKIVGEKFKGTSNLVRSEEMFKMASDEKVLKDALKDVDVEKLGKEIKEHIASKPPKQPKKYDESESASSEPSSSEEKPKSRKKTERKSRKSKKDTTSEESVGALSDASLSETSMTN